MDTQSRWRSNESGGINLAPLLDVIFCLLFFFILATSIQRDREGVEVEIPKGGIDASPIQAVQPLEITIAGDNGILFEGKTLTGPQLAEALNSRIRQIVAEGQVRPDRAVIRSHAEADIQTFLEVRDACAEAGLRSAVMEVDPRSLSPRPGTGQ